MADPVTETAKAAPKIKWDDLSKAAQEVKGFGSSAIKTITKHPVKAAAIPAAIAALAYLVWPKKEQEVTNDQGQTETVRKSGGFKKAVVAVGAIASLAALAHSYGPTKGWAGKILEGRAAKAAAGPAVS